jgi:hypothetical protein
MGRAFVGLARAIRWAGSGSLGWAHSWASLGWAGLRGGQARAARPRISLIFKVCIVSCNLYHRGNDCPSTWLSGSALLQAVRSNPTISLSRMFSAELIHIGFMCSQIVAQFGGLKVQISSCHPMKYQIFSVSPFFLFPTPMLTSDLASYLFLIPIQTR